jgi:hypothetical protein
MNQVKGIEITDKNIKYVNLGTGTYKIDGEIVNINGGYYSYQKVAVKDFNNIRLVEQNTYIENYTNGTDFISVEDYENSIQDLLSKQKIDEFENFEWNSLEDEFAYKKFKQVWQPIKKTMQSISEPIEVEVTKIKYNTGNKYIESCFFNGSDEKLDLFVYNRPNAVQDIVSECFTELGMVYEEGKNYGSTQDRKIWSNSTHSCIRYVVAFGTYVFGDGWDISYCPKGTLQDMRKRYEEDRVTLRNIIIRKYNKHFGTIDKNDFDFESLLNKLNSAYKNVENISPKKNTYQEYRNGITKIKEAIDMINSAYQTK